MARQGKKYEGNKNKVNRLTQQLRRDIEKFKNESTNKYLRELINDQITLNSSIHLSVPQKSVLRPELYLLYNDDNPDI